MYIIKLIVIPPHFLKNLGNLLNLLIINIGNNDLTILELESLLASFVGLIDSIPPSPWLGKPKDLKGEGNEIGKLVLFFIAWPKPIVIIPVQNKDNTRTTA